jgi:hypothetical protein
MVKSVVIALSFLFFCHGFEIESLFGEMVPASWFGLTGQRAGVLVGLIWQVIDGPAEPTCAQIPRHPSSPVVTEWLQPRSTQSNFSALSFFTYPT